MLSLSVHLIDALSAFEGAADAPPEGEAGLVSGRQQDQGYQAYQGIKGLTMGMLALTPRRVGTRCHAGAWVQVQDLSDSEGEI